MRIDTTLSETFDEIYNKLNQKEYGKKLLEIDGISRRALDVGEMSQLYFTNNLADISVDANANADSEISPNNYGAEIVKGIQKISGYFLLHRYAERRFGTERANHLIKSILFGDTYFHDSSGTGVQQPYCMAVSTLMLMFEGRPYGQLHSMVPKRADSFISQCIEFGMDCSQAWCGAIALSDILINYAWYAEKEQLSDSRIINDLQRAVHTYNNNFRVGGQSPFINISIFDMPNLIKLFSNHTYPDGTTPNFEYVMHIQKLFCSWFSNGDPVSGSPYRFPVVTINFQVSDEHKIIDQEFLDFISEVNCRTGCFNIYANTGNKIASCCRLLSDRAQLPRTDSFGNGGTNLGSHRVVTINLPRIAIKSSKDTSKFYELLLHQLEVCRDLLLVHREEILQRRINQGFLKFYKPLGWFSLSRMFSTFGIIGVYEMCYFMGLDIQSKEGCNFVRDVLTFIEDFAQKTSRETGHSFNVEEIPGESVATKFAQKDKILFGAETIPFELYSNQYIPLIVNASLPERIKLTGLFQDILSGGGILHLNIQDRITDPSIMKHLVEYAVSNNCSHLAVNYGFGECEQGHVTVCGNSDTCSICNSRITSHMTRIVGYFTKTSSWGKQRREYEFPRRIFS